MNKKIIIALSLAFAILIVLNVNVVVEGNTSMLSLKNVMSIVTANAENGSAKYDVKTAMEIEAIQTKVIDGVEKKRTCKLEETVCRGIGTVDCTPGFEIISCTSWK